MSRKSFINTKQIAGGVTASVGFTLLFVLVFAFIMKTAILSTEIISSVNAVIRITAILLGCLFFIRREKGAIKGTLLGAIYSVLSSLLFCAMAKTAPVFSSLAIQTLVCGAVGGVGGIFSVNLLGRE